MNNVYIILMYTNLFYCFFCANKQFLSLQRRTQLQTRMLITINFIIYSFILCEMAVHAQMLHFKIVRPAPFLM